MLTQSVVGIDLADGYDATLDINGTVITDVAETADDEGTPQEPDDRPRRVRPGPREADRIAQQRTELRSGQRLESGGRAHQLQAHELVLQTRPEKGFVH